MYKKIFFLVHIFGHVLTILAWTKCRLVTKNILSITHFHSCFFLTFPFKFYLYKKFKLIIKDYLLLIYTLLKIFLWGKLKSSAVYTYINHCWCYAGKIRFSIYISLLYLYNIYLYVYVYDNIFKFPKSPNSHS